MPVVAWLSIAPVKGLALVDVDALDLGPDGAAENRRFFLVDEEGQRYGALRDGRLQRIRPRWDADANRLALEFPDGAVVDDEVELGEPLVSDLHGGGLPGRLVLGPWDRALSDYAGRSVRLVCAEKRGNAVDRASGPVSIVSEASLAELGRHAGLDGPVDRRRFRMLVGVSGVAPHEEDAWCGREVRLGDAVVQPLEPVARCAITTQNPDTGRPDLDTLREIIGYRGLRDGRHADFGVFGVVVRPGHVRVGDRVEPR